MRVLFRKDFIKSYRKLPAIQKQVDTRIALFVRNPFEPILRNHPLQGKFKQYRSINITGDYRAVYQLLNADTAVFIALGTHSQLYK